MKDPRLIEISVGVFVALGLASLLMLAMKVANLADFSAPPGYEVRAYFDNIGGLQVRSPVKMGGVVVGRISDIGFDSKRFQACVTLRLEQRYEHIPTDTAANIYTSGLLGEQYIGLEPGGEESYLKNGSELTITQSAVVLEKMIHEFLYNKTAKPEAQSP